MTEIRVMNTDLSNALTLDELDIKITDELAKSFIDLNLCEEDTHKVIGKIIDAKIVDDKIELTGICNDESFEWYIRTEDIDNNLNKNKDGDVNND